MKKLFTLLAVSAFFVACQKDIARPQQPQNSYNIPSGYNLPECVTPTETALLAGQTTNVGTITVWNDENNVYVHYQTTANYKVKMTHLYVGSCNSIPVNNAGNPRIGQYPYKTNHGTAGVQQYTYTIPMSSIPAGCLCVSAHAEVIAHNASGQVNFSETGWGQGQQINDGGSWAMKFNYCIQECGGDR